MRAPEETPQNKSTLKASLSRTDRVLAHLTKAESEANRELDTHVAMLTAHRSAKLREKSDLARQISAAKTPRERERLRDAYLKVCNELALGASARGLADTLRV